MHQTYFVKNVNKHNPIIGENIYDNNGYAMAEGSCDCKETAKVKKSIVIPLIASRKKMLSEKPSPHIAQTTNNYQDFRKDEFNADGVSVYVDTMQEVQTQKLSEKLKLAIHDDTLEQKNGLINVIVQTTDADYSAIKPIVSVITKHNGKTIEAETKPSSIVALSNMPNVKSIDVSDENVKGDVVKELVKAAVPSEIAVGEVLIKEAKNKMNTTDFGSKYGNIILGVLAASVLYVIISR